MQDLLKFITCGSVDDGKSTLIGHLLFDAKMVFADQRQALIMESKIKHSNNSIDYSLLLDGLMAEREQGITIDVAYRYFATEKRRFIIADTPGHEEYTRNMAVGASFADLAILLVDVSKGVLPQTKRHLRICSMMGIRHYIFAVNKMDVVAYQETTYREIEQELRQVTEPLKPLSCYFLPVSATNGDNLTMRSEKMPWFLGDPLLNYIENVDISIPPHNPAAFVMPVQRVCRPGSDFRGYVGTVEEGIIHSGDELTVLPSCESARVKELYVLDRKAESAGVGAAITITLDREIDISRGCVLQRSSRIKSGVLIQAELLWMDNEPLVIGRSYYLQIGTQQIPAVVTDILQRENKTQAVETAMRKNEIAQCLIRTSAPVLFEIGGASYPLGKFIIVDRTQHSTAACGIVTGEGNHDRHLYRFESSITRELRAAALGQRPVTLWLTGLSGAGKSTIASELEKVLLAFGNHTMVLDGDNIRLGINKYLGFSPKDRTENIRTVAEIAKLMNDAGLIVITALISPFETDRKNAAQIIGSDYVEVYVEASLETCERRDTKGLYKRARAGEIPSFTGISSPYEPPANPDVVLRTDTSSVQECVDIIIEKLKEKGILR